MASKSPDFSQMPFKAGKLKKKSSRIDQWGDRYMTLRDGVLTHFLKKSDTVSSLRNIIDLVTVAFQEAKGQLALAKGCLVSEIRADALKYGTQYVFKIIFPNENSETLKPANQNGFSLLSWTNALIALCGVIAGSFTSGNCLCRCGVFCISSS